MTIARGDSSPRLSYVPMHSNINGKDKCVATGRFICQMDKCGRDLS